MIILTAGHTGPHTGAQSITTQFDEGSETIWLRNRVAEILTNHYGIVVLIDDDKATLQLLTKALNQVGTHGSCVLSVARPNKSNHVLMSSCQNQTSKASKNNCEPKVYEPYILSPCLRGTSPTGGGGSLLTPHSSFLIDIHFNAHSNPQARGTETIVSDHATTLELRFASHLAHTTAHALGIPLRGVKSESQTPHHRLAILHITPQSIILEVCFCTSPEDIKAYRSHRQQYAQQLAQAIAELIY